MRWYKGIGAVSLALGAVVVAAWLGSYRYALEVRPPARAGGCAASVALHRGLVSIMLLDDVPLERRGRIRLHNHNPIRAGRWDLQFWEGSIAGVSGVEGIAWLIDDAGVGVSRRYRGVALPLWLMSACCAIAPVMRAWSTWRMRRRMARGCCADCGYDLRGLKIDCPACAARTSLLGETAPATKLQPALPAA